MSASAKRLRRAAERELEADLDRAERDMVDGIVAHVQELEKSDKAGDEDDAQEDE